ncbi:replication-relaxation family protein [Streptacidiphilus sp. PAMC 29251]
MEADRASEHAPVIVRKALAYQQYASSGIHQQEHGLFPAVVWVVPNAKRQVVIEAALANEPRLRELLAANAFHVITADDFAAFMTNGGNRGQP